MTAIPSYIADAAAEAVRTLLMRIGTPAALDSAPEAAALVRDPDALADAFASALAEAASPAALAQLALAAETDLLAPVMQTTHNRAVQARNQTALAELFSQLAGIEYARRLARGDIADRDEAAQARSTAADVFDSLYDGADRDLYRSLSALSTAAVEHVLHLASQLPRIVEATPATELPSLAYSYQVYGSIDRADQIAARNRLPRPGFVPVRPLELVL